MKKLFFAAVAVTCLSALAAGQVVEEIIVRVNGQIVAEGTAIVIVEQDVMQAVAATSYVYCLQEGRISLEGPSASLSRDQLKAAYFGI